MREHARQSGQAGKGARWMPWHGQAKKGVISCEKRRGAARRPRSGDARMGKPGSRHGLSSPAEYIGGRRPTGRTETSKYPQEKKSNEIPGVAASETGGAQTRGDPGVEGPGWGIVPSAWRR
jgi:hypothetical protein